MTRLATNFFSFLTAWLLLFPLQAWSQQGDPLRGEALYVGTVSFAQGGAPCLACHAIAGHELGYAAGASYGPDLTAIYADYGEEGVAGVLEDLSFTSMAAIYAERPLSEPERADLVAFFAKASQGDAVHGGSGLLLHVALVTALLVGLIAALGWRRLNGVRAPLVDRARYGKGERA